ncbi:unnamed protein product [Linum tenue]|uniref:Uncharacterized protein n=1 Tax=Linum tenue TaxID=586396 RepID=A0AAV0JMC9_9ROSI|nr:unnamed protein product [Linum tenue]
MEFRIVSRELVKPSSPEIIQTKPPHRLCLFDQLTPLTFVPVILFYANPDHKNSVLAASTDPFIRRLKRSLAETLDIYYPFSGRTNPGSLFVDSFNAGLPFTLAQAVDCRLSQFLKRRETEHLNLLLSRQPFQKEPSDVDAPVLELQVSVFPCGGIVLTWACSHKLIDASSITSFLATFCALFRGQRNGVVPPDFAQASQLLPPRDPSPENYINLMETIWFTEENYMTRRFVFDSNSIGQLRAMAAGGGESIKKLSRVEALSCFIWKCSMAASKAVSSASKTSILVEAVNLRRFINPPLPDAAIGNLFWWATAAADPYDESNTEMSELGNLVSEGIGLYRTDYVESLQGEDGFEAMSGYFEQLEAMFEAEKPDIFGFTSWCGFGFTGQDFGWGKPVWVTPAGKVGRAFRNMTVLVDSTDGRGSIEAWVTLDEKRMAVLERDPNFLAFVCPNPGISNM